VPDGEQETIASLPFWVLRSVFEGVEIRDRKDIGDAERLSDIALALHLPHAHGMAPDSISTLSKADVAAIMWN
jgi:hypothetical protein